MKLLIILQIWDDGGMDPVVDHEVVQPLGYQEHHELTDVVDQEGMDGVVHEDVQSNLKETVDEKDAEDGEKEDDEDGEDDGATVEGEDEESDDENAEDDEEEEADEDEEDEEDDGAGSIAPFVVREDPLAIPEFQIGKYQLYLIIYW